VWLSARGDAREASDYDVGSARHRSSTKTRVYPRHAHPAGSYEDRTLLMREIRREGVDL
jgi:hypothetical protein